jgi:hypothetical protein
MRARQHKGKPRRKRRRKLPRRPTSIINPARVPLRLLALMSLPPTSPASPPSSHLDHRRTSITIFPWRSSPSQSARMILAGCSQKRRHGAKPKRQSASAGCKQRERRSRVPRKRWLPGVAPRWRLRLVIPFLRQVYLRVASELLAKLTAHHIGCDDRAVRGDRRRHQTWLCDGGAAVRSGEASEVEKTPSVEYGTRQPLLH